MSVLAARRGLLLAAVALIGVVPPRLLHAQFAPLRAVADSFLAFQRENSAERLAESWPDVSDVTRARLAARLDSLAAAIARVDRARLASGDETLLRDALAEVIDDARVTRVCRAELWSTTNQFGGWQIAASEWARRVTLDDPASRARALTALARLPQAIRAEQALLRRGLDSGYVAAASVARTVAAQIESLAPSDPSASPLLAPAARTGDSTLVAAWRATLVDSVYPAAAAFRAFLVDDYTPRAAPDGSLARRRDGAACYRATLRALTSVALDPDSAMRDARREFDRIVADAAPLVRRLTGEANVVDGMRRLRAGTGFTFTSPDSVLAAYRATTRVAAERFGRVVGELRAEPLDVVPYPDVQQNAGMPPSYQRALDGSTRPAQFLVNLARTERMSVPDAVAHEAYPGHHLQHIAELRAPVVHPVMRTLFVGSFVEGWGIYAERLGDEMGLYATDLDRAGYLVHLADVAMAFYLDVGHHAHGWTREMLVDSMMTLAGRPRAMAEAYADRHAATPGQLATYYVGDRAIVAERTRAEQALGDRFDARAFHYEVIRDGSIPLAALHAKIDRWIAARRTQPPAHQSPARAIVLDTTAKLELRNARVERVTYRGRPALHVLPLAGHEHASDEEMVALLADTDFQDGVIELDVAGKRRAGYATDNVSAYKGFVGVSFRVHGDSAERIYLRTENARLDDQLFRNRSTQYEADPDWPWQRLRKEAPGMYESYVDLEPGAWTHVRIEVAGTSARLYVNGASQPALVVNDLKNGVSRGRIALWTRVSADAYFGRVVIAPR